MLHPLRIRLEKLPRPRDAFDLPLYPETVRPARPRYLNIGALDFAHPLWHNLDNPTPWDGFSRRQARNVHIPHDLMSGQPLPIASEALAVVYCSHVIEHLRDDDARLLFAEVRRVLEPGGTFRLVAPDMALLHEAYLRRDEHLFRSGLTLYACRSLEQKFLLQFASSLVLSHPAGGRKYSDEDVRSLFAAMHRDDAFAFLCAEVSTEVQKRHPADHLNWFTPAKTATMLEAAGFSTVRRSAHAQSRLPILRNVRLFDPYADHSLYFECVK
jgi:SAM-dependent methyltransferase